MAYPFLDFITKFRYKDCRWVVERDFHGNFWVNFKVAEHSFGSLLVYVICQIMQEKGCSSQAETWQVKNTLM